MVTKKFPVESRWKLLYIFFLILPLECWAQDKKISGSIEIPEEDYMNGKYETLFRKIRIYSCQSVNDAERYLKEFESGERSFDLSALYFKEKKTPDNEYKFEIITRNDGGAVLLLCGDNMYKSYYLKVTKNTNSLKFKLEKITGGNKKTKDGYSDWENEAMSIDNVEVTAKGKEGPKIKSRSLDLDGYLRIELDELAIPVNTRSNSRIVVQPYWLDGPDLGKNKVFAYAKPVVQDLFEYDRTQIRRMNFDKEKNDSLSGYIHLPDAEIVVKKDTILISLEDTLSGFNPDEAYPYPARAIVCVEDYNERYYIDTFHIDEGERINYMKFLDFKYDKNFDLDMYMFKEEQSVSQMPSPPIEKQLNFNAGKATINYSDTMNTRLLRELEYAFTHLCDGDGVILKEMKVTGFASPDGVLHRNEELARQRAAYALSLVRNNLPKEFQDNVDQPQSAVRGWDEVEKMMRKDSLFAEADILKGIIDANPGDISKQGQGVSRSGLLNLIKERKYLDRLRSVRFDYVLLQDRTKSPKEIREEFSQGLDTEFSRAQYWELLNSIMNMPDTVSEKKKLLEQVSRRAYDNTRYTKDDNQIWGYKDTVYNDGRWALAANIYATCLIDRDASDLTVLAPFINTDKRGDTIFVEGLNQVSREEVEDGKEPRIYRFTNNREMIANQIIMLISKSSRKYRTVLGDLTNLFTQGKELNSLEEKDRKLIAMANFSRGRWKEGPDCSTEEAKQTRDIVASISPTNYVIVNMAMADYKHDKVALGAALGAMDDLPENSAISSYLKAILELMRKPVADKVMSAKHLADAFVLDVTKMPIANNDGQLIAPDMTKVIYNAFDLWEQRMDSLTKKEEYIPGLTDEDFQEIEARKAQGTWDSMKEDYVTMTIDETHPYTWYKRAVGYIEGKQKLEEIHTDSVTLCLNRCIACNPDYLSVVRVAGYVDNEVKHSKHGRVLFDDFYTSYISEMRKKKR